MTAPKIDTSREAVERLLAKRLENRCAVPCADPRFESFCPICEPRVEGDEMIRALLDERDTKAATIERLEKERDEARSRFNDIDLCKMGQAPCTALLAAEARCERMREALCQIADADWRWLGGGSDVRLRGGCGSIAAKALGLPEKLPLGWPEPNENRAALASTDAKEPSDG